MTDTTNKLAEEQERARFEAYCHEHSPLTRLNKFPDGTYESDSALIRWRTWLAAKSDAAQAMQAVSEPVATQPAEAVAKKIDEILDGYVHVYQTNQGHSFQGSSVFWDIHTNIRRDLKAALAAHPAPASASEPLCACKDRPASQCDEEWGPNCDLGNNSAHARRAPDGSADAVDAALGIERAPASEPASLVDKSANLQGIPVDKTVYLQDRGVAGAGEAHTCETCEFAETEGRDYPCSGCAIGTNSTEHFDRWVAIRVDDTEDDHATIMRLGSLLEAVARAVRGEPPSGTRWGYADLPDRVTAVVNSHALLAAALAARPVAAPAPLSQAVPEGFWLAPTNADHSMCEAAHFGPNCAEDALRSSDREFWEANFAAMRDSWLSRHPQPQADRDDGATIDSRWYITRQPQAVTEDARDGERP